jgi:mRNA interferase RelE/StbE
MYKIIVSNSAEKDMDKLSAGTMKKVANAIDRLSLVPRPIGCLKLKGTKENLWRIRIGDYRLIYLIADTIEVIDVRRVRHRKDVYE